MVLIRKPPTGASSLKKLRPQNTQDSGPTNFTGEEFFSVTETAEKYVSHITPRPYHHPKNQHVPNPAKLDCTTNQKSDYKAWPITVPPRHQAPKYEVNPAAFDALSTSKADYGQKPLPPFEKKIPIYFNSAANMGFSTNSDGSFAPPSKPVVSSTQAQNSGNSGYVPNGAKFDPSTIQKSDFRAWPTSIPQRRQAPKYEASLVKFNDETTQKMDYSPKQLPVHFFHLPETYKKSSDKMESTTTSGSSFLKWDIRGFGPKKTSIEAPKKGKSSIINIGQRFGPMTIARQAINNEDNKLILYKNIYMSTAHSEKCLCSVCTCGRHKLCKPVCLSDAPLESFTEYGSHFQQFPVKVVRGKPAVQELSIGGEFYSGTESREKYVTHVIPPRYRIAKREYIPTAAKLDSKTTMSENYQAWPGFKPPAKHVPPKWEASESKFDGISTSKADFVSMEIPPHFVRQQAKYVKSADKMDGVSTQTSDFKGWGVVQAPSRVKAPEPAPLPKEDRDFKSTSFASYIGHAQTRILVKAIHARTTDAKARFDGISTSKDAYKQWAMPARYQRHRQEYIPTPAGFDGTTNYNVTFVPKTAERYIHPTPVYVPNLVKFEAQSTNKTDFSQTNGPMKRVQDFRPRNVYQDIKDDRDFVSQTKGMHTQKPLPHCAGAEWMKMDRDTSRDGHVHLKKGPAAVI